MSLKLNERQQPKIVARMNLPYQLPPGRGYVHVTALDVFGDDEPEYELMNPGTDDRVKKALEFFPAVDSRIKNALAYMLELYEVFPTYIGRSRTFCASSKVNYVLPFVWGQEGVPMMDVCVMTDAGEDKWHGIPDARFWRYRKKVFVPEYARYTDQAGIMTCFDGLKIFGCIEAPHRDMTDNLDEYSMNAPDISYFLYLDVDLMLPV